VFWGPQQSVRIYGFRRPHFDLPGNFRFISMKRDQYNHNNWSNGLLDMIQLLKSERIRNFILMLEDYWIYSHVNSDHIQDLVQFMDYNPDVLRLDLSNERNSKKGARLVEVYSGINIIQTPHESKYDMSFQAGIWNIDQMEKVIIPNESPWDAEIQGTERVWKQPGMRVMGTQNWPLRYTPALRRHKEGVNVKLIPPRLVDVMKRRGWLDGHHTTIQRRVKG
jgi:hypothetical protein